jgi:signal transduction histidine kinase
MNNKKTFEEPYVASDTVAELSKKLLEANNNLKKAETERKMMLENVSHDLRAPLTAIRSTVDYLMQHFENESEMLSNDEIKSYLKLLDNRTNTLEVLIQDLFFMTCLESGREQFKFEKIPLSQLLEEHFFATQMDEKFDKYNLILDVPDNLDVYVYADAAKLSRVLDNLFNNARKYSEEGTNITLGAYVKDDKAFFYVKDTGYGIPHDALPYIFDRTFRATKSRTPEMESSNGLGLSIARTIVGAHGGSIFCESKEGEGSIFTVEIPAVK